MANVITAKMENLFCEHLEQDAPLCLFLLSDGKGYSKTGGFVRTQQYQYDKNLYNLFGRWTQETDRENEFVIMMYHIILIMWYYCLQ